MHYAEPGNELSSTQQDPAKQNPSGRARSTLQPFLSAIMPSTARLQGDNCRRQISVLRHLVPLEAMSHDDPLAGLTSADRGDRLRAAHAVASLPCPQHTAQGVAITIKEGPSDTELLRMLPSLAGLVEEDDCELAFAAALAMKLVVVRQMIWARHGRTDEQWKAAVQTVSESPWAASISSILTWDHADLHSEALAYASAIAVPFLVDNSIFD